VGPVGPVSPALSFTQLVPFHTQVLLFAV
jgi:hypothetical protein